MNVARPATAVLSTGSVSFPQVVMMVMKMTMKMMMMMIMTIVMTMVRMMMTMMMMMMKGLPAYSHQSYSHHVGIYHNDGGWE